MRVPSAGPGGEANSARAADCAADDRAAGEGKVGHGDRRSFSERQRPERARHAAQKRLWSGRYGEGWTDRTSRRSPPTGRTDAPGDRLQDQGPRSLIPLRGDNRATISGIAPNFFNQDDTIDVDLFERGRWVAQVGSCGPTFPKWRSSSSSRNFHIARLSVSN